MKFYDLLVKHLRINGLINSIFKLSNEEYKAGIEFDVQETSNPFIGYDKTNKELIGSNDGINFFPLYNGEGLPLVVEVEAVNDTLTISQNDGFPVGIISPNNIIIPVQKDTILLSDNSYVINLPAYVIYAGMDNNDGIWKVYVASGARGTKGDKGDQGEKGDKGDKGDNALSVTTPSIETLEPNSQATADVSMDQNGVVTFFLGIPKGEKGEQGIQGEKGDKGDKGDSVNLEIGNVTSGKFPNVEISGDSSTQVLNFTLPSFFDNYVNVTNSNNNTISVPTNSIPVMLKTNTDKYYNIRGNEITLNESKTNFVIDISNALATNNISTFEGNWTVYYAGGAKQLSNVPFSPSVNGVGTLNSSNNEIIFNSYIIESNCINLYTKSSQSGNSVIKIFVDDVELQSNTLTISNTLSKNTINLSTEITGSVKIVRDIENELDTLKNIDVNIYKIEG